MLDLQNRYNLTDTNNGYQFTTETGIVYFLSFIEYPPISCYLNSKTYSFCVERNRNNNLHGLNSEKVRKTILHTIFTFFNKNQDSLFAIYDITDDRQDARRRLFNSWYLKYNEIDVARFSATFQIYEKTTSAVIFFPENHPEKENIIDAFENLKDLNFYC